MSRDSSALSHHPAPHADRLPAASAAFMLFTGPLAWFLQLCAGFMLLSWPCYPGNHRLADPLAGYGWTRLAALLILLACAILAATSGLFAWRKYREVQGERGGGHADLIHVGHGRTRFMALWGIILGTGFTLTTLATLVGFALVPRCVG